MVWGVDLDINVFAPSQCDLGEGIYFDEKSRYIYWVDISKSILLRKSVSEQASVYESFFVGNSPSAILSVENDVVTFLNKVGVCSFDIENNKISSLYKTPYVNCKGFRGNDATVLRDSSILYGTMYHRPEENSGCLYRVKSGEVIELEGMSFNIPNTFIELDNKVLISDSLEQRIYSFFEDSIGEFHKTLWKDFSSYAFTPDGGCTDRYGNIYISMWDGFCVGVFDSNGNEKYRIKLPVPRPTNCTIVDERWLYVTTAREGLADDLLMKYPLSGDVFVIDMGKRNEE